MRAVHIRNLDHAVFQALKRRAAANHRSLEGELREILLRAAQRDAGRSRGRRRLRLRTVEVGGKGRFGREVIYGDDGR